MLDESVQSPASRAARRVASSSLRRPVHTAARADSISLAVGEPHFPTPEPVLQAAARALFTGQTGYTDKRGLPELRRALAHRLGGEEPGTDGPSRAVCVTHGGTAALTVAMMAVLDPSDVVVIPDPTYSLYADIAHLVDAEVRRVPSLPDGRWDLAGLGQALAGARAFVFCNPCNPTGTVHTRQELQAIAELVQGTDTVVIADEAYRDIVFGPAMFASSLDIAPWQHNLLYCHTFSKSYSMTGFRVGALYGGAEVIEAAASLQATMYGSISKITQLAAVAALSIPPEQLTHHAQQLMDLRDILLDELSRSRDLHACHVPGGAFYAWVRYSASVADLELVARAAEYGVLVRPGSEFGPSGHGHVRISFAAEAESIRSGIRRLDDAVSSCQG